MTRSRRWRPLVFSSSLLPSPLLVLNYQALPRKSLTYVQLFREVRFYFPRSRAIDPSRARTQDDLAHCRIICPRSGMHEFAICDATANKIIGVIPCRASPGCSPKTHVLWNACHAWVSMHVFDVALIMMALIPPSKRSSFQAYSGVFLPWYVCAWRSDEQSLSAPVGDYVDGRGEAGKVIGLMIGFRGCWRVLEQETRSDLLSRARLRAWASENRLWGEGG
jgi:hypothetical protein